MEIYRRELFELANIRFHGFLHPNSSDFRRVVNRCFCFIAPSCSEGTSPAVVTALQVGLYPIISKDTGVLLSAGNGIMLADCEPQTIHFAILKAHAAAPEVIAAAIKANQAETQRNNGRRAFRNAMQRFLSRALRTK